MAGESLRRGVDRGRRQPGIRAGESSACGWRRSGAAAPGERRIGKTGGGGTHGAVGARAAGLSTEAPIDAAALAHSLKQGMDGAVVVFDGIVRDNTRGATDALSLL